MGHCIDESHQRRVLMAMRSIMCSTYHRDILKSEVAFISKIVWKINVFDDDHALNANAETAISIISRF